MLQMKSRNKPGNRCAFPASEHKVNFKLFGNRRTVLEKARRLRCALDSGWRGIAVQLSSVLPFHPQSLVVAGVAFFFFFSLVPSLLQASPPSPPPHPGLIPAPAPATPPAGPREGGKRSVMSTRSTDPRLPRAAAAPRTCRAPLGETPE